MNTSNYKYQRLDKKRIAVFFMIIIFYSIIAVLLRNYVDHSILILSIVILYIITFMYFIMSLPLRPPDDNKI